MEIQSAFNAGVQGFQKATEDANQAAADIARNTAGINEPLQTTNEPVAQSQSTPNLTQSIVDLKVAEYQAKGSAEVVKTADENLGTLLDVRV